MQDPIVRRTGGIDPTIPSIPVWPIGRDAFELGTRSLALTTPVGGLAGGIRPLFLGPRVMTNRGVVSGRILAYRVQRGDFNGETSMLTLDDGTGTYAVPHPYVLGTPPAGMVPVVP